MQFDDVPRFHSVRQAFYHIVLTCPDVPGVWFELGGPRNEHFVLYSEKQRGNAKADPLAAVLITDYALSGLVR